MAWAGTGALWALNGGVAHGALLDKAAPTPGFSFLQLFDSHVGFAKAANPDARACSTAMSTRSCSRSKAA